MTFEYEITSSKEEQQRRFNTVALAVLAEDDVCLSVDIYRCDVHIFLHTSQRKTNDDDDDGGGCGWMEKGELDSIFALVVVVVVTLAFHGASFFLLSN